MIDTAQEKERGILVTVVEKSQPQHLTDEHLDELAFLAATLGIKVEESFGQRLEHPDPRTFVGKGKLEEINAYAVSYTHLTLPTIYSV